MAAWGFACSIDHRSDKASQFEGRKVHLLRGFLSGISHGVPAVAQGKFGPRRCAGVHYIHLVSADWLPPLFVKHASRRDCRALALRCQRSLSRSLRWRRLCKGLWPTGCGRSLHWCRSRNDHRLAGKVSGFRDRAAETARRINPLRARSIPGHSKYRTFQLSRTSTSNVLQTVRAKKSAALRLRDEIEGDRFEMKATETRLSRLVAERIDRLIERKLQ